ncbi:rod shape-determining protein MreC [Streptomyces sp. TR02-1]|uniref:rod shape-determining protein MreC n=1 Tax=Streptomyces sp. TR02-1 TaxID=3385977 RepID=UPI0039A060F6
MRDSRESRLLLVLLVAIAFALITVDLQGGEQSPLDGARRTTASALGPVQEGVSDAVDPVGHAISAVRESGERHDRLKALRQENMELRRKLGSDDRNRSRARELDSLLRTAGAGGYGIKAAEVIGIGAAQGFSWTATIDVGSEDGITPDMTVINGAGLVGRTTTVGTSTSTILLANDPDFTVGTRMEGNSELGFAAGQGSDSMTVQLLNGKARVEKGDRLVTFGSHNGTPFVPGVPVGEVSKVERQTGDLTRTLRIRPFARFTRLDLVGIVVEPPRKDPRDKVLRPKEPKKPEPAPTVTVTATPGAAPPDEDGAQAAPPAPGDTAAPDTNNPDEPAEPAEPGPEAPGAE